MDKTYVKDNIGHIWLLFIIKTLAQHTNMQEYEMALKKYVTNINNKK